MDHLRLQASAYQELLGLSSLPSSGRQAHAAARQLGAAVLAGAAAPPLLSQLVQEELASWGSVKARFVDVSTGLRLRYLEWGSIGASEAVLLLHDLGESADVWRRVGPPLASRGYRVIALDLRGHGESGRSLDGRYSAEALAEDVKAFIVAQDMYVAPVAVVGCGMGAAAGLALAQSSPFLVGALVAAEFTLPVAAVRDAAAAASVQGACPSGSNAAYPGAVNCSDMQPGERPGGRAPAIKPRTEQSGAVAAAAAVGSKELLPWWGFRPGQASQFASVEQCAAFLAHPLCNMAPGVLLPMQAAAAEAAAMASTDKSHKSTNGGNGSCSASSGASGTGVEPQAAALLQGLFAQLQRPLRGAAASACSLLRLPPGLAAGRGAGGGYEPGFWEEEYDFPAGLSPRMDPNFLFTFDAAALLNGMPDLSCHLLLLQASRGSWADQTDAAAMAAAAVAGGAASASVGPELPGAGHWLAADHPDQLLQQISGFLDGAAVRCFQRSTLPSASSSGSLSAAGSAGADGKSPARPSGVARRPELLDLKPLPQYATLEEAQKALGPRAIPSAAAVEAELRRLRLEEGRGASDVSDDEGEQAEGARHRTALSQDPPTYFGFVG